MPLSVFLLLLLLLPLMVYRPAAPIQGGEKVVLKLSGKLWVFWNKRIGDELPCHVCIGLRTNVQRPEKAKENQITRQIKGLMNKKQTKQ